MLSSSSTLWFTLLRDMPIISASSLSGGSLSPGLSSPEIILLIMACVQFCFSVGVFSLVKMVEIIPPPVFVAGIIVPACTIKGNSSGLTRPWFASFCNYIIALPPVTIHAAMAATVNAPVYTLPVFL